jgi:hypothetical protein
MLFPSRIRDRGDFPGRRLELELRLCLIIAGRMEGIGQAGAGRVLALLVSLGRYAGRAQERKLGRGWAA